MTNIYYKSDFKLRETHEDLSVPFKFTYHTSQRKYIASFDGENYTNCKIEDGVLVVIFDSHGLGSGKLTVVREWFLTDQDFGDGVFNKLTKDSLDVYLTNSASDNFDIDIEVAPSWSKGDPFTYDDFTPEQLEALRGDDYVLTDQDKQDIADLVDSSDSEWVGDITDFNDFTKAGNYGVVSNNDTLNRPTDGFHNWSLEVLIKSNNWVIQRATRRDEGDTMLTYIRELDGSTSSAWVSQNSGGGSSTIIIDSEPTEGSNNAVSSGGVYNAIDQSLGNIGAYLATI